MKKTSSNQLVLELAQKATKLRIMMVEMLRDSETSGHYGGGMSVMDILTVLYFKVMNIDPVNPDWPDRDRFVLSKGHACCALCPVLAEKGYFSTDILATFNQFDSPFGMHPDMHKIVGCDMSTGSLGHGIAVAVGMALAGKYREKNYRIYTILGDGEVAEGSVWEAFEIASHFKLDNLCAIIDRNRQSNDGPTEGSGVIKESVQPGELFVSGTLSLEPLDKKIDAFGWHVIKCNGHDIAELLDAYEEATTFKGKPSMIIADTIKGKGISFIENDVLWHYAQFNEKQTSIALKELNCRLQELVKKF